MERKIPLAEARRRVRVTVVMGFKQRAGDPDNYLKCLLDAMQDAKLLVNDNHRWCEASVRIERNPDCPGTKLELWEI